MNYKNACIYTCLMGSYEKLNEFQGPLQSRIPRICFTDNPDLESTTWTIRVVSPVFPMDSVRSQRRIKILAHEYLPEYDTSPYVDNTVALKVTPESLFEKFLTDESIAVPRHSFRNSVLEEFVAVAKDGLDEPSRIFEQLNHYQFAYSEVLSHKPYWTAILLRQHNRPEIRRAMVCWYNQVMRYSRRDQLSFNVALADSKLDVHGIEIDNSVSDVHQWPILADRDVSRRLFTFAMSGASATAQLQLRQEDLVKAEMAIAAHAAEVADMRSFIAHRDQQILDLERRLERADADQQSLKARMSMLTAEAQTVADLQTLHQNRIREVLKLLGEERARRGTLEAHLDIFARASASFLSLYRPSAISRMKTRLDPRRRKKVRLIAASRFFDANWYLQTYPDISTRNIDPAEHYLVHGAVEGRNPGPEFETILYLRLHPDVAIKGMNPLLHFESHGRSEGRTIRLADAIQCESQHLEITDPARGARPTVDDVISEQFPALQPFPIFRIPTGTPRVTIVTDSINAGSLFGGVGTALIFGTVLARHLGARLRVVTLTQAPDARNFAEILRINEIPWSENAEFAYIPRGGAVSLPVSDNDIFLTTSWWTTESLRQVVKCDRIVYLLQEDERMFYPAGDEQRRCANVLADPHLRFVVNTQLLYRHLTDGPDPLSNLLSRGVWFEPAFPSISPRQERSKGRRQFFFYARPHNLRNLYFLGLEVLRECLIEDILSPEEWDIHFVGRDLSEIELPRGVIPQLHQNMPWAQYTQLVQRMDVGLSLMETPHPSYPPLDLAAAGAVVVTNTYGLKTNLDHYSPNIICAKATVDALKNAIAEAVQLSADNSRRADNIAAASFGRDWQASLAPILSSLFGGATSV